MLDKLGKYIGAGGCRKVYEHKDNPEWVIKVAKSPRKVVANRSEWNVWQALKDTPEAKYLAPCIEISEDNKWLVQMKAKPATKVFRSEEVRWWMKDFKLVNMGMLGDRLVFVDYDHPHIAAKLGI